ncbi:MAG TPA: hypothetical protein VM165_12195 [Planctomycetaceae bacterium]|nr:hypothetical protein [Planctomycetaceae bacterium]
MRWSFVALMTVAAWGTASAASAQGLVMRLPADGTWVRYEGTFTQTEIRPDSALGKLEIPPWREQVTVKSVGTAMAEYRGETVPCRWIEIKVERGREADGKINVGLTGLELYKVLVPEAAVLADPVVEPGVPIGYLPIIKGARQLGKGEPKPLVEPALKLYPLALLFAYCRDFKVEEQNVDPMVGLGAVSTNRLVGTSTIERDASQTKLDVQVWTGADVPFGVAAWTAKITRSIKDAQQPRDAFKPLTEVVVDLKARETGADAQSEVQFE